MKRFIASIICLGVIASVVAPTPSVYALEVSQTHPLFVFSSPEPTVDTPQAFAESMERAWSDLPEFYQAHGTMVIPHIDNDMTTRAEWTQSVLDLAKAAKVPLSLSIANGKRKQYFLPDLIEVLLKTYPSIQTLVVDDFQFDTPTQTGDLATLGIDPHIEWLKFIVSLAGKYDKRIIIRLSDLNPIIMTSNPTYRSLYDTLVRNKSNVILVYSQGGPHTILGNTTLLGLWLEGAVGQWGVALDSLAYSRAGFVRPGEFSTASETNTSPAQSASIYRGWLLNSAMIGATTFFFDNADDLWAGTRTRFWGQAIAPTLLEIVQKGYIARHDLVARNALVAYRVKPAATWSEFQDNLVDLDGVFYEGRMAKSIYGIDVPGQIPEWIPNTGRYYYIPILSPYASDDVLFSFKEVMMPGAVQSAAEWLQRLDGYYKPDADGTAFVKKIGRAFFVFNTRENTEETQTYTIAAVPAPLHDISATREGGNVTVTWPFREGDVSYSVYRAVNPDLDALHLAEFLEVAKGIDTRTFLDEGLAPGQTILYSVTALTNERATLSGVINYGEYRVLSAVESRRDAFALIEPYTMRSRTINGISEALTEAIEPQPWWAMPQSEEEHVIRAGISISETIIEFSNRYQQEDLQSLSDLIADDYSDSAGTTKPILVELFETLFEHSIAGPVHRQIRSWNLNDFEFSGEIIVNAFLQLTALQDSKALVPHPIVSFPRSGATEFEITFYEQHDGTWKIKKVEPPLLRVRDVLSP